MAIAATRFLIKPTVARDYLPDRFFLPLPLDVDSEKAIDDARLYFVHLKHRVMLDLRSCRRLPLLLELYCREGFTKVKSLLLCLQGYVQFCLSLLQHIARLAHLRFTSEARLIFALSLDTVGVSCEMCHFVGRVVHSRVLVMRHQSQLHILVGNARGYLSSVLFVNQYGRWDLIINGLANELAS